MSITYFQYFLITLIIFIILYIIFKSYKNEHFVSYLMDVNDERYYQLKTEQDNIETAVKNVDTIKKSINLINPSDITQNEIKKKNYAEAIKNLIEFKIEITRTILQIINE